MVQSPPTQQSQLFDMPSGAKLAVTIAPFLDSWSLMKATLKTLKGLELKPEHLKQDVTAMLKSPAGISMMLDRIVEFTSNAEVEAAIWKCAARVLYIPVGSPIEFPGGYVTPALFADAVHGIEMREDWPRIIVAILEVNCKPFLAKALSGLQKQKGSSTEDQPSKSI